jgi:hypothetical protein
VETQSLPDNDTAKIALTGISFAFIKLFEKFNENAYIEACYASAELGLLLRVDSKAKSWLVGNSQRARKEGVMDMPHTAKIEKFREGVVMAWKQKEATLPEAITPGNALHFLKLARLLRIPVLSSSI